MTVARLRKGTSRAPAGEETACQLARVTRGNRGGLKLHSVQSVWGCIVEQITTIQFILTVVEIYVTWYLLTTYSLVEEEEDEVVFVSDSVYSVCVM